MLPRVHSELEDYMSFRKPIIAAACAAVMIPLALSAQTSARRDTTKRDTTVRTTTTAPRSGSVMQTPTAYSQQRVRVQKDYRDPMQDRADSIANAERMRRDAVDRARQDSVDRAMQATRDSAANIEKMRADSIARIERTRQDSINAANAAEAARESARRDSIARADSITAYNAEQDRLRKMSGSSWHIGLSAGAAVPSGDFKSVGYNSGFDLGVPIEYHRPGSLLGLRVDLGYTQFSTGTFNSVTESPSQLSGKDPKVLSATANLTAHMPLTSSRKVNLYALGGGGVYHFRNVASSALGAFLGNDVFDGVDEATEKNKTKYGLQAGGGLDFGFGRTALYVESRFVHVFADRSENVVFDDFFGANRSKSLHWVPIVVGVKIR